MLLLITAAGAFAFRLPSLDARPMHGDEANQAVKAGILLDTGEYAYDPVEHHGPTLYYLALPVAWVSGATGFAETTEWTFRLVPLMFGAGAILLLIPLRATLGTATVVTAAVLTAVSPAMVFYSRYFIQEMLLVCFVFGVIVCGWRYVMTRSIGWAVATGIFAGLAHASKETCVIAFAGMVFAAIPTAILYNRFDGPNRIIENPQRCKIHHAVACVLAAVAVSVLFYSSFFTHPRGVVDSVLTYANYFQKADSSHIHDKPWYYYLHLLAYTHRTPKPVFSEGLILGLGLLGMIAAVLGLRRERRSRTYFLVFLALYTLFVTAVYAYIPYKTPWNALNFLQPLIVLAGAGAVWLFNVLRYRLLRAVAVLALAGGIAQLGAQAYRAAYVFDADVRNPYVYAHTSSAFMQMVQRVEDIAAISPEGRDMLIRVISPNGDYWPLPWYLRKFTRVGYWTTIPEKADASVILAPAKIKTAIDPHLKRDYQVDTKSLRPGVLWVTEIRSDLWDRFMETRQ
ncbi:MAG: hypothetical protein AMXMBFR82_43760 [Candidatus Hydrogenedentota bacterium]